MAVTHIRYDTATSHGSALRSALAELERGLDNLNKIRATMAGMIDGDGSNAAHFPYMVSRYGFPDNAAAKAAWDEINSLLAKLNTDAAVTFVQAALLQAFAKFR